jgi:predicted amidohydrolase YtcJ
MQDELNRQVHEATARGYRLEIHVIGDAAADAALTALEYADVAPQKRPILTHCQVQSTHIAHTFHKQKHNRFSLIVFLSYLL